MVGLGGLDVAPGRVAGPAHGLEPAGEHEGRRGPSPPLRLAGKSRASQWSGAA